MPIRAICPSCHTALKVREELAGKRVKCPKCQAIMEVPPLEASPPPAEAARPAEPIPPAQGARLPEDLPVAKRAPRTTVAKAVPPPLPEGAAASIPAPADAGDPSDSSGSESFSAESRADENAAAGDGTGEDGPADEGSADEGSFAAAAVGGFAAETAASPFVRTGARCGSRAVHGRGIPSWVLLALGGAGLLVAIAIAGILLMQSSSSPVASKTAAETGPEAGKADADKKPTDKKDAKSKPSEPALPTFDLSKPVKAAEWKVKVTTAKTPNDVLRAMVKIVCPQDDGMHMEMGSGFFINKEGWVATNHHVIADATSNARAENSNGAVFEIDGIVANDTDRDLAILKIKDPPPELMILDISYKGDPELGQQVNAFGHPKGVDFSLSGGRIGRVLMTSQLNPAAKAALLSTTHLPDRQVWIQHDARIYPGNSGGPLFDDSARVLGINTFVDTSVQFGYASHIRYLREMAEKATGKVQPLPKGAELAGPGRFGPGGMPPGGLPPGAILISPPKMQELFEACKQFDWKPSKPEHYQRLGELARMITAIKQVQRSAGGPSNVPPEVVASVSAAADQLAATMSEVVWNKARVEALNKGAAERSGKPGEGLVLAATVERVDGDGLVMKVDGDGTTLNVKVPPPLLKSPAGSRWILLGVVFQPGPTPVVVSECLLKPKSG